MNLLIHSKMELSYTNGPGKRAVIWLQGCSLNCPGCFNPLTHSFSEGQLTPLEDIQSWIKKLDIELNGITISGGEPLQQFEGLLHLLRFIKTSTPFSLVLFSGYTIYEISKNPGSSDLFRLIDVLIAGRYLENQRVAASLKGSSNKRFYFFSNRYSELDFRDIPVSEIILDSQGNKVISGINPWVE